ncbi:MAG: nitroreductase family deazaflavin-dependent oxidoreductase [Chloroflexota bacterium]
MTKPIRPNAFHRAIHRILMLRPVTAILIHILHRADTFLWKLNGGRFSVTGLFAGMPTYRITTIGAKSRLPRPLPLVALPDGEKFALIASNFGQAHNPSWYYNLKAHPECHVYLDGADQPYTARQVEGPEREHYWNLAVSYYAGYRVYEKTAGGRRIPVMVLEPHKELPLSTVSPAADNHELR